MRVLAVIGLTSSSFAASLGDSQLAGNAMQLGLGGHVVANGPLVLHTQGSSTSRSKAV
jgi:hypothetical protein